MSDPKNEPKKQPEPKPEPRPKPNEPKEVHGSYNEPDKNKKRPN